MPILSRRSQSQYCRRQTGSGQSLNGERKKRHGNAVYPASSAVSSHRVTRLSSVCRQEVTHSTIEHSRTLLQPPKCHDAQPMTSLPEVNCTTNGSISHTGSSSLCPMPPTSPPSMTYYGRPAVRQRRLPGGEQAREREALKRQQRLQVLKVNCKQ